MDNHTIFGSNIKLPSIEGIQSECEDTLYILMKEIDLAFQRSHSSLLKDVEELRIKCLSRENEIASLKLNLRTQVNKKSLEDQTKYLVNEIGKLKEENNKLKAENTVLKNQVQDSKECDNRMQFLTRTQEVQEEENSMLKDRLNKLHYQHCTLQENYQKLLQLMSTDKAVDEIKEKAQSSDNSVDFIDVLIAQETDKFMKEESDYCSELQAKINREIEELRRTLNDENISD